MDQTTLDGDAGLPEPFGPRGYTLVEVMIAAVVLTVITAVGSNLLLETGKSQGYARDLNRVTEIDQQVLADIRRELEASVAFYGNDLVGNAYRGVLELPADPVPLRSSSLPTVDVGGSFGPEATPREKSGNALLFARQAWATEVACGSGREYRVDVYRVVHYYLARPTGVTVVGQMGTVLLSKFVSEPMADASQVDAIGDPTDLADVLRHLAGLTPDRNGRIYQEVQLVWFRHQDPTIAGTFRQIDPATGTLSSSPSPTRGTTWTILADPTLTVDRMLARAHVGVATNRSPHSFGVAWFSQIDATGDGFPHGLEVQAVGPTYGQLVMVHLAIAGSGTRRPVASAHSRAHVMLRVN